ncbi:hypothetical protein BCR41DRAFT_344346 [Lobosporangium transversale]|uniref:NAD(P)-binding domain-containing protein n=1 Tax=Lobosporangium transversale TaxID=64571 RepID=A0A1Y2H332_9FUNG|nr:hypothetical protein BCR41DRAFT_344346 [Lobosporangium transversale]ORZ28958.1 hypothetical protein BCR41DRAFT_344346 [Lobosporangium transversale]|eukprot:XP_021886631.1 hypothetical protein BCR41DRAFT_344346 [Lobosporangium transversale]
MSSSQFIAFFGATGGCTNACLVHTLNAGFHATALARTPSKLIDMLHGQGISQATIDAQLTIIKGDISDIAAIKSVLLSNKDNSNPVLASQIISGIGGTPQLQRSLKKPVTIDNPEICATATKNVIQVLQQIYTEFPTTISQQQKPVITVISTTGVSDVKEDVPFGFQFLYHVLLADPHKDKKVMEKLITENTQESDASKRVFRGAIIVRPSLLTGDHSVKGGKGWKKLKTGQEEKPAVGYTVHRADVGQWIFEQVVKTGGESYLGQRITLTN